LKFRCGRDIDFLQAGKSFFDSRRSRPLRYPDRVNDDFVRPFDTDSCLLWHRFVFHSKRNPAVPSV